MADGKGKDMPDAGKIPVAGRERARSSLLAARGMMRFVPRKVLRLDFDVSRVTVQLVKVSCRVTVR